MSELLSKSTSLLLLFSALAFSELPSDYTGTPFEDSVYQGGAQEIPGRIQCEYYDLGGEGTAYHDNDENNNGSGSLNPADGSYLHEFRIDEGVDISYTKSGGIDDNPYNLVDPEMDQLYVGWTGPGEWINFTVDIDSSAYYSFSLMYTSNAGGSIQFFLNNTEVSDSIPIPTTYVAEDPTDWRQWHHWNKIEDAAEIYLEEGLNLLTLLVGENGNMNFDYFELTLPETPVIKKGINKEYNNSDLKVTQRGNVITLYGTGQNTGQADVSIIDASGREILSFSDLKNDGGTFTLETNGLSRGWYCINISQNHKNYTVPFIFRGK